MEEEEQRGRGGELKVERILLQHFDGRGERGGRIGCAGAYPVGDVLPRGCGERRVKLDADDLAEAEFAGDQQAAALAGADVDEGIAGDGVRRHGLAPVDDERAQDAGRDTVVGSDVFVVGVAGDEVLGRNQPAGVDAVHLVEGMDGKLG